mmetsp:Transcript_58768/g.63429  ORF Transcript_58768/g.63429 Transcript_58768/m.63429 type:complete len:157 (-) Transcript_58768:2901-3371(-)
MKYLILGFLIYLSVNMGLSVADKASPTSNFRVVLDSPPGNNEKTRLMLKNKIQSSVADVDLKATVERAKKEFHAISVKTKHIGEEAREIVETFKGNLQLYTKKELGLYAALTVALTVTLKSKRSVMFFLQSHLSPFYIRFVSVLVSIRSFICATLT